MLGLDAGGENPSKKAKVSNQEKHKAALSKVMSMTNKLGRAIGQAEQALPGMKRAVEPSQFQAFRKGLHRCRSDKEDMMFRIEDLKEFDGENPDKQEEQLSCLKELLKESTEHLDALQESRKKLEPAPPPTPPIKNEAVKPVAEEGEDGEPAEEAGTELDGQQDGS